MRVQRSGEHRVVPWANGLGITADVFLSPEDRPDWDWRLSIADVSDDVPFSVMPGIDRHIMVAQGAGMALTVDGAPPRRMEIDSAPLSFDGDVDTTCRLLDGPIADLNLMVRRGRGTGSLRNVALRAGQRLAVSPADVAVVVLGGVVSIGESTLDHFDAALLDTPVTGASTPTVVADVDARIAVATYRPTVPSTWRRRVCWRGLDR